MNATTMRAQTTGGITTASATPRESVLVTKEQPASTANQKVTPIQHERSTTDHLALVHIVDHRLERSDLREVGLRSDPVQRTSTTFRRLDPGLVEVLPATLKAAGFMTVENTDSSVVRG